MIKIEIINYIRKVKLSNNRRAKYWLFDKVMQGKQKLPKKYLSKPSPISLGVESIIRTDSKSTIYYTIDTKKYAWKEHKLSKGKSERRLINKDTGEYVIKNTKVAGTEKWEVINSQKIYNGGYHPVTRAKIITAIHDQIKEAISKLSLSPFSEDSTIQIRAELYDYINDPISRERWDLSNRMYIWHKSFSDVLQEVGLIKDDSCKYLRDEGRTTFIPIESGEPKIIFYVSHTFPLVKIDEDGNKYYKLPNEDIFVQQSEEYIDKIKHPKYQRLIE